MYPARVPFTFDPCYIFKLLKIEKQDASLQLELRELQTDQFLSTKKIGVYFEKKLFVEKYSCLRDFALKQGYLCLERLMFVNVHFLIRSI